MNLQRLIFLAIALAGGPVATVSATAVTAEPTPAPTTPAPNVASPDALSQLAPPVRGVVKMLNSGISQDVVNAYIQNAPSAFNLTPDDIIHLQDLGVSGPMTAAMLNHDKALRDNPSLSAAPAPPPGQPAPGAVAPPMANDSDVYNNLSPYGSWSDAGGYGPYWQPYSWVGNNYYPWAWLGFGYWWNFPGHGWCWFPHSHFHGFAGFHGTHGSSGFSHSGGSFSSGFAARVGTSGGSGTVHSGSPWVSGFAAASRGGSGSGFRSSASVGSSFRGGTGGGFRGGGGGFHGGGGGFHGGHR